MTKEEVIEYCAELAHEANRSFCDANGDFIQLPWEYAPEWQRVSAIQGVRIALDGATPEQQHQAWYDYKEKDGWKLGPVKDAEKKEHPCMVPYDQLPDFQKKKDELYITVVNAMYKALTT
jgi:hypothetical protein